MTDDGPNIPSDADLDTPPGRAVVHLLSCAVVSLRFRTLLLANPARALAEGYYGELFSLSPIDRARILVVRCSTLPDLARHLLLAYTVTPNGDEKR